MLTLSPELLALDFEGQVRSVLSCLELQQLCANPQPKPLGNCAIDSAINRAEWQCQPRVIVSRRSNRLDHFNGRRPL